MQCDTRSQGREQNHLGSYQKCTLLGLCPTPLKPEKLDVVQESVCRQAFWVTLAHSLRTATDTGEHCGGGGAGTERPSFPLATAARCISSAAGFAQNAVQLVVSIIKTRCLIEHRERRHTDKESPKMVMMTLKGTQRLVWSQMSPGNLVGLRKGHVDLYHPHTTSAEPARNHTVHTGVGLGHRLQKKNYLKN